MGNTVVHLKTSAAASTFRLAEGVQVRREKFGLLFYDYRGPRLYFLPSKELLGEDFFDGNQTVAQLADALQTDYDLPHQEIRNHLAGILQSLAAKGLIHEQPLC